MKKLIQQTQLQLIDLVAAWNKANANQKQELAKGLFPEGLVFSNKRRFFEPQNVSVNAMASRFLESLEATNTASSLVGAGDGI
jgi:hypothetical protein